MQPPSARSGWTATTCTPSTCARTSGSCRKAMSSIPNSPSNKPWAMPPSCGYRRHPADVRRQLVNQVLGELGLLSQRTVQVGNLSDGQRRRATLALELLTGRHCWSSTNRPRDSTRPRNVR
ncbi:putative ABC transporter-related protein [Mycobacterium xenopi 3993]|nr:putative ABC transporter-related protein [Mycobacterium xenopi 3993]